MGGPDHTSYLKGNMHFWVFGLEMALVVPRKVPENFRSIGSAISMLQAPQSQDFPPAVVQIDYKWRETL